MIRPVFLSMVVAFFATGVSASNVDRVNAPDELKDLVNLSTESVAEKSDSLKASVRRRAMKQAAEAVGVQKGYAARMTEYHQILMERADHYDKVFDFSQLMELVPGNYDNELRLYRLPAVIQEARNHIEGDDTFLTATGTSYRFLKNTRLTTVPPTWRDYLLTSASLEVNNPARAILPKGNNEAERELWAVHTVKGWKRGLSQADQEIQLRIDRFRRDFVGMARYLRLLEQGLIDPDYVAIQNQMISGGGDRLSIDKTTYQITSPARFNTEHEKWRADSLDPRESYRETPIEDLGYEVYRDDGK